MYCLGSGHIALFALFSAGRQLNNATDGANQKIRFRCPHCSVTLASKSSDAGRQRQCPKCDKPFKVPRPKKATTPDAVAQARKKVSNDAARRKKRDEDLIAVVCGVCQTRVYAGTAQIGSTVECPDCFTQNMVKPPPKEEKKTSPRMDASMNYDIEPEQVNETVTDRGQELLEEADRKVVEELEAAPKLPNRPFVDGVYTYPFRLMIFPLLIGITLGWTCFLVAARLALVLTFMIPAAAVLGIMVVLPALVTYQRIFENTSNGDDESDVRPEGGIFGIIDWLFEVIPIGFAAFLSLLPAAIPITSLQLGTEWALLAIVSVHLIFPVIFMSMAENASVAGVYSGPVWGSLTKLPSTWFKFYASSTLLLAIGCAVIGGFAYWRVQVETPSVVQSIGGLAVIVAVWSVLATIYFRLLGRVGLVLSEKITITESFPEDESTESE